MNAKLMIGLAAVTAVVIAGAVAVSLPGEGGEGVAVNQRLYPALGARINDIQSVAITRGDTVATLKLASDGWTLAEKSGYPANFEKVRRLMVELTQLTTEEAKTRQAASYASLEVEDAGKDAKSTLVTLKDAKGDTAVSLLVGKTRFGRGPSSEGVYVRKAGDAQAWLAKGRLAIERESINWLDRSIANLSKDRVQQATVLRTDGKTLTVKRDKASDKDFTLVDMPEGRKVRSAWDTNDIAGMFENLELEDVKPVAEVAFPEAPGKASATTFDGLTLTAEIVEIEDNVWARLKAAYAAPATPVPAEEAAGKLKTPEEAEKEAAALNAKLGAWAYKLTSFKGGVMKKQVDDLLAPPEEKKEGS